MKQFGCAECGFIECVCAIVAEHGVECTFRFSATCPIPIACEHGFDVCPVCDPCTCKAGLERVREAKYAELLYDLEIEFPDLVRR
jgi:hypothetical protein